MSFEAAARMKGNANNRQCMDEDATIAIATSRIDIGFVVGFRRLRVRLRVSVACACFLARVDRRRADFCRRVGEFSFRGFGVDGP
eukprot:8987450-Pyramimonas_sp.AAC.1